MSIIHNIENNPDSESHLEQNLEKFSGDCLTVMRLLYKGIRLTGRMLERDYDLDSRRLRDCYAARPDIVKRTWVLTPDGKRTKWKQYYIEIPMPPSKKESVEWATKVLDRMANATQRELF